MSDRPPTRGCYICEPDKHQHNDPECDGCDQGCCECFGRFIDSLSDDEFLDLELRPR